MTRIVSDQVNADGVPDQHVGQTQIHRLSK